MSSESGSQLVELSEIRAAFSAFRCSNLGDAYVVRDRLAVAATQELDINRPNEHLILLQSLLRATYGIAVANDLPVADTVGYASMWRAKIAALATLSDRGSSLDVAVSDLVTPRAMSFSLHRYTVDSLLDAVAAALALPSHADAENADVPLPDAADRSSLESRSARYWGNRHWTNRPGPAGRAFPVLHPSRTSVPRVIEAGAILWGDRPRAATPASRTIPEALRIKIEQSHDMSKVDVLLDREEAAILREDPIFAHNPHLIQSKGSSDDYRMDVDGFLVTIKLLREPVKVGLAAEIHEVFTRKPR